jgi:hypothetical protein
LSQDAAPFWQTSDDKQIANAKQENTQRQQTAKEAKNTNNAVSLPTCSHWTFTDGYP